MLYNILHMLRLMIDHVRDVGLVVVYNHGGLIVTLNEIIIGIGIVSLLLPALLTFVHSSSNGAIESAMDSKVRSHKK